MAVGVDAVVGEVRGQGAVGGGERGVEVHEAAVFAAREALYAAVHVADRLYGRYLWSPVVACGGKYGAEHDPNSCLLGFACHLLYILHYQAVRDVAFVLRYVVCAAADDNGLGVVVNHILIKAGEHLRCHLTALSAVEDVVFAEKFGVSAMLGAIPAIKYGVAHKYGTILRRNGCVAEC